MMEDVVDEIVEHLYGSDRPGMYLEAWPYPLQDRRPLWTLVLWTQTCALFCLTEEQWTAVCKETGFWN